mmetsp:Transcript_12896/g.11018  ORF Transcript_12896/g.11018 Transcript_12896/m.11018 type:complete len:149 (-) Transcript_12896:133-579(-)|eukprot:CAMPEP_0114579062 /NCGR_PEP_ID=MMETSP0125-20121206/3512_1 /TAXON_ID=485358 ORGANISM="Aristerostoma sp., Strain ATCC 50986" /NCGR_SAMPLE_ID=MMETSP0125 /ASSEMBLY_ACC=CAM_ASM_000245 /LENGTH=148 /DNA_ID=CAMNT_0001769577 /DNA_START=1511 /DNA_END=1957 /DNA_ORIENTATION=+
MANYHVPIYPVCFSPNWDDPRTITEPMTYWVPLFENYNYGIGFENHVHLYKRTKPLRGGVPADKGVMYLGDGNWGTPINSCWPSMATRNDTGIYDVFNSINSVFKVEVTKELFTYRAVNASGFAHDGPHSINMTEYLNRAGEYKIIDE